MVRRQHVQLYMQQIKISISGKGRRSKEASWLTFLPLKGNFTVERAEADILLSNARASISLLLSGIELP